MVVLQVVELFSSCEKKLVITNFDAVNQPAIKYALYSWFVLILTHTTNLNKLIAITYVVVIVPTVAVASDTCVPLSALCSGVDSLAGGILGVVDPDSPDAG